MSAQSAPNFDLCVVCKTSRLLCGEKTCPLLKKWFSNTHMVEPKITKLDDSFAPPAFFVGYVGYPRINAGPMITADRISSELIDNAEAWVDKTQEEIVQMRLSLFRTHSRIDAKKPLESDIIQRSHEVLLGVKSVDVEIELEKPIIPRILLNERTAPSGPIAPIKKLIVTEEGKSQVERLREIGAAKIKGVLERMPDNALVSLQMGLEALIKALEEEGEVNGCN